MTTSLLVDSLLALVPEKLVPKNSIIGPAQLGRLPLFLYAGGNTRAIVDTWFHRAGIDPKPIMELGNVEAIKVLVASSLGGSILPNLALHKVTARTVGCRLPPLSSASLPMCPGKRRWLIADFGFSLRWFQTTSGRLADNLRRTKERGR
jgi:DNA-binding transcriptional LysR family regulator